MDFVSSLCYEHYDHPNNMKVESDAFYASGLVVMVFLLVFSDLLEMENAFPSFS